MDAMLATMQFGTVDVIARSTVPVPGSVHKAYAAVFRADTCRFDDLPIMSAK